LSLDNPQDWVKVLGGLGAGIAAVFGVLFLVGREGGRERVPDLASTLLHTLTPAASLS
jgi:hypothetical protein